MQSVCLVRAGQFRPAVMTPVTGLNRAHRSSAPAAVPQRGGARAPFARIVCLLLAAATMLLAGVPARAQIGFDRPGADYTSSAERSADPAACAARCDRDNRCRAWSFVYPTVPARIENPCCVSGVRGSGVIAPRGSRLEFGIDRLGGDYSNIEVAASPTGQTCADACAQDKRCRAWTYARAGYGLSAPRCYLKDKVTPPRRRPCCISGVVR